MLQPMSKLTRLLNRTMWLLYTLIDSGASSNSGFLIHDEKSHLLNVVKPT